MESVIAGVPFTLPTSTISLIGFITAVNLATVVTFIRYIQKKNGHLERVAEKFTLEMANARDKFDLMLAQQSERHEAIMKAQIDEHGRLVDRMKFSV